MAVGTKEATEKGAKGTLGLGCFWQKDSSVKQQGLGGCKHGACRGQDEGPRAHRGHGRSWGLRT